MAASPSRRRLALIVAVIVVAVDALSKAIAAHYLAGRGVVNLFGGRFHLELYRNHAGPGNTFAGHPALVSWLSIAAVIVIGAMLWAIRTRSAAVALGLLLGGGIGNLIDRLVTSPGPLRGGVIDWIKPTLHGGSMNVADLSINAAVIVLIVGGGIEWWLDARARRVVSADPSPSEAAP